MYTLKSNYLPPSWVLSSEVDCLPGFGAGRCWPPPPGFYQILEVWPPQLYPPQLCTHTPLCTTGVYLHIPVNFPSLSLITSKFHCKNMLPVLSGTIYPYCSPDFLIAFFFFSNYSQLRWHYICCSGCSSLLNVYTEPNSHRVVFQVAGIPLGQCSRCCPPGVVWQCLETFLVVTTG